MRHKKRPDLYKGQVREYHRFRSQSFSWEFLEKPTFDKHFKKFFRKHINVLDAGCGNGVIVGYLLSKGVHRENIVGADSNKEMLDIAAKTYPNVTFIHSDINKVTFKSLKFDLITASMVLQHFNAKSFKTSLQKFHEWLVEGGTLFYIVPHPTRMVHDNLREYFVRKEMLSESPWGTKIQYYHRPLSDYINETIKAGFVITAVDEPEPMKEGKKFKTDYEKYTSFPSRLVVRAVKG